jgi:signal transduction histidine kinase
MQYHPGRQKMKIQKSSVWLLIEQVMPWFVLAILLFYTYAKFFAHPYGLRWEGSTGIIIYVFDKRPEPTLKEGDQIIQIGPLRWEEFQADLRKTFFDGVKLGDVVPIVVNRNGQNLNISWTYPGINRSEFLDQFYSEWGTAYFFWLAGTRTILFIRPKDDRWLLMALFNFLTAIWLIAGSGVSAFHIWNSALVLRMAVILCVPVYLHFHRVFPQPFAKISPLVLVSIYAITLALVMAQWFQILPSSFYFWGFMVALGGSFILLLIHILRQPFARGDLRLLFVAALLAMVLAMIWEIFYNFNKIPLWLGSGGLFGLPLLPLAYLYSAFRRRLGGLELRVNRFFSIYLFVILLGIIEVPLIVLLEQAFQISGEVAAISLISAVLTAAGFIWGYPVFEDFVERRILAIPLQSKHLLETYSIHITTSVSLSDLIRVLHEEILPSLLIRQFAFLQLDQGSLKVLSSMGLSEEQLPKEQDVPYLMTQSGVYRSPDIASRDRPLPWARLILPLKLGDQIISFWLLGRRDPDDIYSLLEIPILNSLANLTAIALSNILQTERLKSMYEVNINRYEQEKLRLAHDLHDSILNELAALLISPDAPALSSKFQHAFDALTERLREIVDDLRPPMLAFGLKLALEDFAENLMERNQDSVEISAEIQADGDWRYPEVVENNLYRIVQEACENSLHHAHAKRITIFGRLHQEEIDIRVGDDGIGFNSDINLKLDHMLANKHFGLVGMLERANLIGADISVNSKPNQGTKIQATWKSRESI